MWYSCVFYHAIIKYNNVVDMSEYEQNNVHAVSSILGFVEVVQERRKASFRDHVSLYLGVSNDDGRNDLGVP